MYETVFSESTIEGSRRCISRSTGEQPQGELRVEQKRLSGGLEVSEIALITVRYNDTSGRPRLFRTICKRLVGRLSREAAVYELLNDQHDLSIAPRLILVERSDRRYDFLSGSHPAGQRLAMAQPIDRARTAPALALFHKSAKDWAAEFPQWDYEADLCSLAEEAWTSLDRCRLYPDLHILARACPAQTHGSCATEDAQAAPQRGCDWLRSDPWRRTSG
jgi:hypothetical protein